MLLKSTVEVGVEEDCDVVLLSAGLGNPLVLVLGFLLFQTDFLSSCLARECRRAPVQRFVVVGTEALPVLHALPHLSGWRFVEDVVCL